MTSINEDELKARLDPLSYEVLRNGATERPFTGEYTDTDKVGSYRCKACNAELFKSETKFHSGCGWPSFYAPIQIDCAPISIASSTTAGISLTLRNISTMSISTGRSLSDG